MTKEQEEELMDAIAESEAPPSVGYSGMCDGCTAVACEDLGRCAKGPVIDNQPNNRPQDGRVCNCEDAPCCGHYES